MSDRIIRDIAAVLNEHGVDTHLRMHDFVLAKYAYESLLTLGSTLSYESSVTKGPHDD